MKHVYDVVQKTNGDAVGGASVKITIANATPGTGALATIYSDNGSTATANPTATVSDGSYSFWIEDGRYDVLYTATGLTTKLIADMEFADITQAIRPVSLAGQSASIGTTTIYSVPATASGIYKLSTSIICTATGTGNVNASLVWNNGQAAKTLIGSTISLDTLGNEAGDPYEFYSAASQNISYSTTYLATGSYDLRLRLEYVG